AGVAGEFGNEIHGHANGVSQGFILMANDQREGVEEIVLAQKQFVVVGAYRMRNLARVGKLAWIALIFFVISNREGPDWLAISFGKQGRVSAGVNAAGEKHADRDITDFAELNSGPELGNETFGDLRFG